MRKLRNATHTKKVAVEVGIVLVVITEFAVVPVDRQQIGVHSSRGSSSSRVGERRTGSAKVVFLGCAFDNVC